MNHRLVLLTGATGYVGGRLLKKLEALGVATRCLARRPEHLRDRIGPGVEVVAGDVMDSQSLAAALAGVHTAYYLIHSMGSAGSFEDQDRLGAQNFGQAARAAGVQRIVYLGGLGDEQQSLSPHLRSRHEVGDLLRASGVPVIEFRASIVGMLRGIAHDVGKPVMSAGQSAREGSVAQWLVLALFVLICLGTAGLGAAWTNLSVGDWYATLNKPSWNPPKWVFGPVWTTLYIMMAIAAWLVWRSKGLEDGWLPLLLFGVQLFLNAAWSALFFGMRSPGLAFADVVLLWFAILATIVAFGRVSSLAATLLVPYLAWVSFATALNWSIWRLNS